MAAFQTLWMDISSWTTTHQKDANNQSLAGGTFALSVRQLETDVKAFIDANNDDPKTLSLGQIRRRNFRRRQTLLPKC